MTLRWIALTAFALTFTAALAGCCCGSFGEEFQQGLEEGFQEGLQEASEAAAEGASDTTGDGTAWGVIEATRDTRVYATPSTTSEVVANMRAQDEFQYHGFDDSMEFYVVQTDLGAKGYVPIGDADVKIGP